MAPDSTTIARDRVDSLPSIGDVLDGRYEVLRLIGEGGMGMVVEARDRRLDRAVAVKLMHRHLALNADFVKRFEREVLIAKKLNHPNTVRVYDFGVSDAGVMYLVMEHLNGRELKQVIAEGPMSVGRVYRLALQLLDGLAEAHAIDVVHRDLKPGNLYVCEDRRGRELIKILDFGIAKSLGDVQQAITNTGQVVGTAPYLAPELFITDGCTKSADIYACGLILIEMLLGRKLIEAPSLGQTMSRHIHMPIILPKSLRGTELGRILLQAVAKAEGARFQDAEEMLEALQAVELADGEFLVPPGEVEEAMEKMFQAYERNAQGQMGVTETFDTYRKGTMVLEDSDLEVMDSSDFVSPQPTAVTMQATPRPGTALISKDSFQVEEPITGTPPRFTVPQMVGAALILVALSVGLTAVLLSSPEEVADPEPTVMSEGEERPSMGFEFIPDPEPSAEEVREVVVATDDGEADGDEDGGDGDDGEAADGQEAEEPAEAEPAAQPARTEPRRTGPRPSRPPRTTRPAPRPEPEPEPESAPSGDSEPDIFDSILDQVLSD